MTTNAGKESRRNELFVKIQKMIDESGLFSEDARKCFMNMLEMADELMDIDLITMFLIRDGMKRHSFPVVKSFIRGLPLNELRI